MPKKNKPEEKEEKAPDFVSDDELDAFYEAEDKKFDEMAKGEYLGKIVGVELGTLGDFIEAKKLKNPESASRKVVNLHIETPKEFEPVYVIRKTLSLSLSPQSSMVKYERRFGSKPKVGMDMPLFFDKDEGFWMVNL